MNITLIEHIARGTTGLNNRRPWGEILARLRFAGFSAGEAQAARHEIWASAEGKCRPSTGSSIIAEPDMSPLSLACASMIRRSPPFFYLSAIYLPTRA